MERCNQCHKKKAFILIFLSLFVSDVVFAFVSIGSDSPHLSIQQNSQAGQLNWVSATNPSNRCCGYYWESQIPYTPNPYLQSQESNYDIVADSTILALKGTSTFKGHVVVTQPHREMRSDIAYLHSDPKTGKKTTLDLINNVRFMEPGRLMVGTRGHIDFRTHLFSLQNPIYRIALSDSKTVIVKNPKTGKTEKRMYQMTGRGSAKSVKEIQPGVLDLKTAFYTTCPPTHNTWKLRASKVRLDFKTGRGYSYNTRLHIHGVPIFYTPYFNFPIDKRRYSGFLVPSFGSSSRSGFTMKFPYYFNLAPNHDFTLTPSIMAHRGLLLEGLYRYLTPINSGALDLNYIASDRGFRHFQNKSKTKYAGQPTINELIDANDDRGSIHLKNRAQLNPNWISDIHYNYVSDDYFLQDFGRSMIDVSNNQLLQQANIEYLGPHWNFLGNVQNYQTLHPVNQATVLNQYARLPQLQLNANYPDAVLGWDYGLKSEFVHFYKESEPITGVMDPVFGNRAGVRPIVRVPLTWPYAYMTPRLQVQLLKYDSLKNTGNSMSNNPGMSLPIFDIKTGLYFDRHVSIFHQDYQQTLEPVAYYLYVPYHNQHDFPIFDTTVPVFTYDQMFQDNRFSGVDRIGDANQITLGVTTRFIDTHTGNERAKLSIGQIHYFRDRKVQFCYGDDCSVSSEDKRTTSPLAAMGTYNFNLHWSASADGAWNTGVNGFDNANASLQYKRDVAHIINIAFHYKRKGDVLWYEPMDNSDNNLQQTDISTYWHLNNRWSVIARWNYNWSHGHDQAYLYGLEYESCCWAIRFVNARTFIGPYPAPSTRNKFDRRFYIQIVLKGLGNVSHGNPVGLLSHSISGYVDHFGQEN